MASSEDWHVTIVTKDLIQKFLENMARCAQRFAEAQQEIEVAFAPYRAAFEKLAEHRRAYQSLVEALRPSGAIFFNKINWMYLLPPVLNPRSR